MFKPLTEALKEFDKIKFYDTPHGKVPSVTSILKILKDPQALVQFKKYNRDEFERMLEHKAKQWWMLHKAIEDTYKNWYIKVYNSAHFVSFFKFYNKEGKFRKPIKLEETIYCDKYAGTFDALMKINDEDVLIDRKTFWQRPYDELIFKYKLQVSAYNAVVWANHAKIVLFSSARPNYLVINLSREELDKHYQIFLQVLNKFYEYYKIYTSSNSKTY